MYRVILCTLIFHVIVICDMARATERAVPVSRTQAMLSYAPVVKNVTPAVVNIYTRRKVQVQSPLSGMFADPFFNQFFAQRGLGSMSRERVVASLGSGVIIDPKGLVVTSYHVIDGAEDIVVVLEDQREFRAQLSVADPSADLAILTLEPEETTLLLEDEKLPSLAVVNSDLVQVGDLVLAVGNPFGVGQTVTSGIVSALSRSADGVTDYDFFIQTDAAINPGNSGGALVNMRGELIGVNTAIFSKSGGSHGIGFAIPSNMVLALLRNTQADGTVLRPWLGAVYQDITPEIAESLGLRRPLGVLIAAIIPDSPAERSGLAVGDVILEMDELDIRNVQELKFRIHTASVEGYTKFRILRNGREANKQVRLKLPPEKPKRDLRILQGKHPLDGLTVANLSPRVAIELGLDAQAEGVVIYRTPGGAQARSRYGLRKGDIITQVNDREIRSTIQLEALMQDRIYGWTIRFLRGNKELALAVRR